MLIYKDSLPHPSPPYQLLLRSSIGPRSLRSLGPNRIIPYLCGILFRIPEGIDLQGSGMEAIFGKVFFVCHINSNCYVKR